MTVLMDILVGNALAAAVLAVVVVGVTRIWRNPHVGHVLWLLVLLKLVVPPAVEVPIFRAQLAEGPPAASRVEPPTETPRPSRQAGRQAADAVAQSAEAADPRSPTEPPPQGTALPAATSDGAAPPSRFETADRIRGASARLGPGDCARIAWLAGSVCVALVVAWRAVRFGRAVREMLPASTQLQATADELASRLRLRRSPAVRLTTADLAPLVWCGVSRPTIVLPSRLVAELAEGEIRTILAHELAHLARRDHWTRWLEVVVTVLYWWHPAVWIARRELRRCEDLCCDAYVLRLLPASERTYAEAMLRTASLASHVPSAVAMLASSFGQSGIIKRRIEMVLKHANPRPLKACVRALLAVITVGVLAVSIGITQGENFANEGPGTPDGESTSLPKHAVRRYGSAGIIGRLLDGGTATTADGRLAATIEPDGTLAIWDVAADRQLASLEGNSAIEPSGAQIEFSPDASKIMANCRTILYVWDIGTARLLFVFEPPENSNLGNEIISAVFSPNGTQIAACREDERLALRVLHVWEADTGDEILTVPLSREIGELQALAFASDGKLIAVATRSGNVAVWDFDAGEQITLVQGAHSKGVNAMIFSEDNRRLFTGGTRSGAYTTASGETWAREVSELAAWDLPTGERTLELEPPQEWEGDPGLGLSADGRELYSLHDDQFAIWNADTGELKRVLDRTRLGPPIGPADEIITVHSSRFGRKRYTIDSRDGLVQSSSSLPISIAVLSDDGERLVTAGAGSVHVWDAARGTVRHVLDAGLHVQAIADVSSEGLVLALTDFVDRERAGIRSQVRAWERYTGGLQYAVRIKGRGRSLSVSPDGKRLAVLSHVDSGPDVAPAAPGQVTEGTIEVLDAITGQRLGSLRCPTRQETGLQFSPESDAIASIAGAEFRLWDIESGEVRKSFKLEEHSRIVPPGRPMAGETTPTRFYASAISPDLRWAVTTGLGDSKAFVWDIDKGTKHKELTIDGLFTSKLAISQDSRLLAVSGFVSQNPSDNRRDEQDGNTVTLWDIRHGRQLLTLQPDPSDLPNSISFSPDGKYLLSASGAKSAILWDLSEARAKLD
jgi:WD40 repeat protein/beta-lactamase regulating signal transducer with metallopeptidase domain